MGYAATINVIYGIEMNEDEVEAFLEEYAQEAVNFGAPQAEVDNELQECHTYCGIDYFVIKGEGADSRVHDTDWHNTEDRLYHYTLGFELGGKGYGCNDDVVKLVKSKPSAKIKADWDNVIGPILKNIGITTKPEMLMTNQVH